ncbi:flagellin [Porticoccaceae bacterium]|nr:flagellin [Porticoccaceae bacterium]
MTVINTNTAATLTANALTKNERAMSQAMERLSTGVRINSAGDDAAGLAISSRMTSQINGLNMAVRNTNDAISYLQTADGAIVEISNMLQRMRELAVQAASGTMGETDQDALNVEFEALEAQIQDISTDTEWNGIAILDGQQGSVSFQVGANAGQTIALEVGDYNTNNGSESAVLGANASIFSSLDTDNSRGAVTDGHDLAELHIDNTTSTTAPYGTTAAIYALDHAIDNVNADRAAIGATINRLEFAADNLANVSQNTSASRSRILDADYASETTELARTQIIQQAGTAMLSQANQQAQSVLALLK